MHVIKTWLDFRSYFQKPDFNLQEARRFLKQGCELCHQWSLRVRYPVPCHSNDALVDCASVPGKARDFSSQNCGRSGSPVPFSSGRGELMVLELLCSWMTQLYMSQQLSQEEKWGLLPARSVLNTHNCSLQRYLLDMWKTFSFPPGFLIIFSPS